MNLRLVARLLGRFVMFFALSGLPAYLLSLTERSGSTIDGGRGLLAMAVAGLVLGSALILVGRRTETELYRRESLLVVALAWVAAGWLGSLPFSWSGAIPDAVDAFFECVSGLATCGATVLGAKDHVAIHELPDSLLLWRSFTQWMGGLGIILMFVVLFPALGISPWTLMESEAVGVSDPRVRPRMVQRGRVLLRTYLVLTLAEVLLLWGPGGLSLFKSICHAMTTMATGGFSTEDYSIAGFASVTVEIICIVFMLVAACNFLLIRDAMFGGDGGRKAIWKDPEFRLYLTLFAGSVLFSTVVLRLWGGTVPDPVSGGVRDYSAVGTCLRDSAFNFASFMSCTGYGTANVQCWPQPIVLLAIALMFVGGCTGSTAGGIKMFRLLILWRVCLHKLRSFVRPRSVEHIKINGDVLDPREVAGVCAVALIFASAVLLGTLLLTLDPRLDAQSALSACVTAASGVGPGFTAVIRHGNDFVLANAGNLDVGPFGSFGELTSFSKLVMSLLMILGRLEFLALLCVLTPGFWRRR